MIHLNNVCSKGRLQALDRVRRHPGPHVSHLTTGGVTHWYVVGRCQEGGAHLDC
jgi:hypothetical protein